MIVKYDVCEYIFSLRFLYEKCECIYGMFAIVIIHIDLFTATVTVVVLSIDIDSAMYLFNFIFSYFGAERSNEREEIIHPEH